MTRSDEKTNFWSRRKAGVQEEAALEEAQLSEEKRQTELKQLEKQTDAEILEELGLPEPESLTAGDDFSGFMSKSVPERLRRRALRQLWGSNPVLANVDGLVDYGEDFTDSAMVLEGMQTAYQVGKGMLKHVEEMARQSEEVVEEDDSDEAVEIETARLSEEDEVLVEEETVAEAYVFDGPLEEAVSDATPRRRMQFAHIETDTIAANSAVTE